MQINYTVSDNKYALKIFILFCLFSMAGNLAYGQYATGGSSTYRDQVLWLTWGDGTNGTANQPLDIGSSSSASIQVAGGSQLVVQCSIDAVSHSGGGTHQLESYRPGDWMGDVLDDLYNIGGTGANNELINGISRSGGVADFTVGCTATLAGQPYNLKGLVMADAEAINTGTEYVEATAAGTWNVVEMAQNPGAGSYNAVKTNNGGMQTIRFGPGTDNETAAVSFLSFTNPSDDVSMDFSIEGGGTTAIAIGLLVPYADFGDAPASYGDAMHLVNDVQFLDDNLPADGNTYDLNDASYEPGGLAPSMDDFIGTQGADTELNQQYDSDAAGDDNSPTAGSNEEDAWPDNYSITVLQEGETLSESIACTGDGMVAGWIDFDRNGTFDSDERAEASCSGGTADLSWTISSDITAGVSYVRLRYGTVPAELADPTGTATDGEVEDHAITIELVLELTGGECFRMLSSPVDGLTYQTMLQDIWTQGSANSNYPPAGDANVWTWDIDAQDWSTVPDLDTVIPAGQGFLVSVYADDDYDGTADPFPKFLTLPAGTEYAAPQVGSFGAAGTDDWVLLGNPFLSNIATGALTGTASDLYDAYYVYDRNIAGWRSTAAGFGTLTDGAIAAGQGFFVQASGDNPDLDFTNAAKTTDGEFYGKQAERRDYVRLDMSGEEVSNSLWIRFSPSGSLERTGGDALKLDPLGEQYALLGATKADGTLMDIAHYPLRAGEEEPLEIPVSAEATVPGTYTLSAAEMDRPTGMALYLYDRQTGQSVVIDDQFEYTFSISQAGKIPGPETGRQMTSCTATPERAKASGTSRFLITSTPGTPQSERPSEISLEQNYPNPFNPTTQITYKLPEQSQVRLEVFDMAGRMVATLVNEQVAAGTHQVNFDAGDLSSGIYVYRLQTGNQIITKKLTLIK